MKVAVTGASGFVGSHVARAFDQAGWQVTALGRRPGPLGDFVPWDALDGPVPTQGVDLVIHAAADTSDRISSEKARRVNVDPVIGLVRSGVPFVHISSSSVYGRRPRSPAVETDPYGQGGYDTHYASSKAASDLVALSGRAWVLRPRAVYGEGDPTLLPRLMSRVRGRRVFLPGPDIATSLTSVKALAAAAVDCLGWAPGAYNIADEDAVSRDQAAREAILAVTGRKVSVVHVPLPLARAVAQAGPMARAADISRYAVEQASWSLVLDVSKALRCGFSPADIQDRPGGKG